MHDTIDAQQITAPIMDKYIRYSEASKVSWYQSIYNNHSPFINISKKKKNSYGALLRGNDHILSQIHR